MNEWAKFVRVKELLVSGVNLDAAKIPTGSLVAITYQGKNGTLVRFGKYLGCDDGLMSTGDSHDTYNCSVAKTESVAILEIDVEALATYLTEVNCFIRSLSRKPTPQKKGW